MNRDFKNLIIITAAALFIGLYHIATTTLVSEDALVYIKTAREKLFTKQRPKHPSGAGYRKISRIFTVPQNCGSMDVMIYIHDITEGEHTLGWVDSCTLKKILTEEKFPLPYIHNRT